MQQRDATQHDRTSYLASCYPGLIHLQAGTALHGTDNPVIPGDGEAPLRCVSLSAYALGATAVTNEQYAEFVSATRFVTDAERAGQSMVFQDQVAQDAREVGAVFGTPWWRVVRGANWRNPTGAPGTDSAKPEQPVVHVSWHDAVAYCHWAKGRLPTEAEWEHAARGGLADVLYPWGNEDPIASEKQRCNIWRGEFPRWDISPPQPVNADCHAPNGYGFYNMCGNVWEWTDSAFDNGFGAEPARRILKGGSFLCCDNYCFRYRIAARIGVSTGSTTSHQGFRIAFDIRSSD